MEKDVDETKPLLTIRPVRSKFQIHLVELSLIFYVIAASCLSPLLVQYVYSRLARQHGLDEHTHSKVSKCSLNKTSSVYKTQQIVESESSHWMMYYNLATTILATFTSVFYGTYSDKGGRKISIAIPMIGMFIRYLIWACVIYFDLHLAVLLVACIIDGISGFYATLLQGVFSYIADITHIGNRTFRMTVISSALVIVNTGCQLAIGYGIHYLGFLWSVVIVFCTTSIGVIYSVVFLKETIQKDPSARFFNFGNLKIIYYLYTKPVNHEHPKRHIDLLFMLGVCAFSGLAFLSRIDIQTLYQIDAPLCWDSEKIGYFAAAQQLVCGVAMLIFVKVLQCWFSDLTMALITGVFGMASITLEGFAFTNLIMYLVIAVGFVYDNYTFMRASMSKLVKPNEQGAVFASLAVLETLVYGAGSAIFNSVYSATLSSMPSAVFLVMAGIYLIGLIILIVLIKRPKSGTALTSVVDASINTPQDESSEEDA